MAENKNQVELTITIPVYGGEGMGRAPDGRAVFVPFALPGERVAAEIYEDKRGFARARLLRVLEPSPRRIAPRCRHFGVCGGCHYQNLAYADQLTLKRDLVREQLARLGGIAEPPVAACVPSPQEWNYRNHVQFDLDAAGKPGYHAPDSNILVPVQECFLPEALIDAIWPTLEFEDNQAVRRVSLRAGHSEDAMIILEGEPGSPPELAVDFPVSVTYLAGEQAVTLAGDEALLMHAAGQDFQVSPASFFQVNTQQAEAMLAHVLELVGPGPLDLVLDIYCGVGLFSAFLAPRARRLIGVEISESACRDFVVNLDAFDNVELMQSSAEAALPVITDRPDLVVVDPPRAGLGKTVLDAIANLAPARLIYISCDPATLARDAKRLAAHGYALQRVTPFDLFPQTYHIESVSLFVPAAKTAEDGG
jgi:23S rRNA (uracil1939-C5)-methyltransferase